MWDLFKDLIIAIVGAGIGVWSAFSLFYKQIKLQREEEQKKAVAKRKDELTYFASIMKNVINVSKSQVQFLSEFTDEIAADDVTFHLLKQTPTYYLNRIVQSEKLQDYLLAYTETFDNNINSIKSFNQMIAIIDYLYASFQSIQDQVFKSQQFDFERKKRLEANFNDAYSHAGVVTLAVNEEELRQKIFGVVKDLSRLAGDNHSDLKFFDNHFFTPVNNLITAYYIGVEKPKEDIFRLGLLIMEWKNTLKFIKLENNRLRSDILLQKDKIEEELNRLNKISKTLLDEML